MSITVAKGYTFGATELVTSTKLHLLVDNAVVSGATASSAASFNNGDLSSGIYTFNHTLTSKYVAIAVFDNNDKEITPDEITASDTNNAAIDLSSYGTISGTWNVRGVV